MALPYDSAGLSAGQNINTQFLEVPYGYAGAQEHDAQPAV